MINLLTSIGNSARRAVSTIVTSVVISLMLALTLAAALAAAVAMLVLRVLIGRNKAIYLIYGVDERRDGEVLRNLNRGNGPDLNPRANEPDLDPPMSIKDYALSFIPPFLRFSPPPVAKTPIEVELEKLIALDPSMEDHDFNPNFICPISRSLMLDPVLVESGHTYDRSCITEHLKTNSINPMTNQRLESKRLTPNIILRSQIIEYLIELQNLVRTGNREEAIQGIQGFAP